MSNDKWTCFNCRSNYNRSHSKCPSCREEELQYMGKYFKPPKREKDKEWRAIEIMIKAGVPFHHNPSGKRPRHPRDVKAFLDREDVKLWLAFVQKMKNAKTV